jgi:4-hydroxy-2-oxoheptanedioate aldolase
MTQSPDTFLRNDLLDKLARDEVVSSMILRFVANGEMVRIAHTAGFDSFYVDMEHSTLSDADVGRVCLMALALGITPLVRVPDLSQVQRVLDAGALGVIVPHVRSAAEAAAAVAAVKYPPAGARGFSSMLPQLQYRSFPSADAQRAVNRATMVVVMIEDPEALEVIDEIAAVDGVDLLHIGTNDLTTAWGIPSQYDDYRVVDAYARTIAAARRYGKYVGTGGMSARQDKVAQVVKMGARYVSTGADLGFMVKACTQEVKQVKALPTG